jgi:hypothetical protein
MTEQKRPDDRDDVPNTEKPEVRIEQGQVEAGHHPDRLSFRVDFDIEDIGANPIFVDADNISRDPSGTVATEYIFDNESVQDTARFYGALLYLEDCGCVIRHPHGHDTEMYGKMWGNQRRFIATCRHIEQVEKAWLDDNRFGSEGVRIRFEDGFGAYDIIGEYIRQYGGRVTGWHSPTEVFVTFDNAFDIEGWSVEFGFVRNPEAGVRRTFEMTHNDGAVITVYPVFEGIAYLGHSVTGKGPLDDVHHDIDRAHERHNPDFEAQIQRALTQARLYRDGFDGTFGGSE